MGSKQNLLDTLFQGMVKKTISLRICVESSWVCAREIGLMDGQGIFGQDLQEDDPDY